MAAEHGGGGGLPHMPHILPAMHFPALPGAPATESYAVSFTLLVIGLIVAAAFLVRIAAEVRPVGVQNFIEWLMETVDGLAESILGKDGPRFAPLFVTIFLFILAGNLIGLVPGCMSPTASYHTNIAMAILVALTCQYAGIRKHGVIGYLSHLLVPPPCPWPIRWFLLGWLWPLLHILEELIRPLSLTMRLFGNLFAKESLLLVLAFLAATFFASPDSFVKGLSAFPFALRIAIILLGTLVSIVQAAVFTILSMVFVSLALAGHDDEGHEESHGGAPSGASHH